MTERWSDTCRTGAIRIYVVKDSTLTLICHDIDSYALSFDSEQNVVSVDPTGGPYLSIGSIVRDKWVITRIQSHRSKLSVAMFVFEVKEKPSI